MTFRQRILSNYHVKLFQTCNILQHKAYNLAKQFTLYLPEAYSEPCQTSKMERFVKIFNNFQSLTFSEKAPP